MAPVAHSKPWILDEDIAAVSEVLASSMIGQGALVRRLERRLAGWLGMSDGVAAGSGSAALELALRGLGIGPGDEVVAPTYVCRSIVEAVLTVGAAPVLCDAGPDWVTTPGEVGRKMSGRCRAIVVPHLYGIFADIDAFRGFGVPIIEDCAQALDADGARPARGDVAVLSFHPTKCVAAGEGGLAVAADEALVERMRQWRDGHAGSGRGYAARVFSPLSDLAAALALRQLDRYDRALARRREIAGRYAEAVAAARPEALNRNALGRSMHFRFPIRLPGGLGACESAFARHRVLVRKGVDELLHRGLGLPDEDFPSAVAHFETTVSIPIYPALTGADEARCIAAIADALPPVHP